MAIPIRFAPVLEGDEAREFYEKVKAMENVPDPTYPSKKEMKEMKKYFREQMLRELI
jgi:hypothetical protein